VSNIFAKVSDKRQVRTGRYVWQNRGIARFQPFSGALAGYTGYGPGLVMEGIRFFIKK